MDFLNFDRVIALVSIVLSAAVSYYFYRRALENKKIVLGTTGPLPVIERAGEVEGLTISYRGKEVAGLYRHFILVWNRGNEPVEKHDFASVLRIDDPGAEVLAAEIVDRDLTVDATISRDDTGYEVEIALIRPADALLLGCYVARANFQPQVIVELKSHRGVKRYNPMNPYIMGLAVVMPCMIVAALGLGWLLASGHDVIPTPIRSYLAIFMFLGIPLVSVGALFLTVRLVAPSSTSVLGFQAYDAMVERVSREP